MRQSGLILLLLCSGLVAAADTDAPPPQIELTGKDTYELSSSLSSYTENGLPVSAPLAYQFFLAGKFQPVHRTGNAYINDGLLNKNAWWAFTLSNNSTKEQSVVLESIR